MSSAYEFTCRDEWNALSTDEKYLHMHIMERSDMELRKLLDLIPECPIHGPQCFSHAQEWVKGAVLDLENHRVRQSPPYQRPITSLSSDTFGCAKPFPSLLFVVLCLIFAIGAILVIKGLLP